jgi:lysophospholipase L1-like esterase
VVRKVLGRLALALMGLAAGFVITECSVEYLLDPFRCDAELGWSFEPGSETLKLSRVREFGPVQVRVNADGFRDDAWSADKPAGAYRIAVLGDSIVAALQVDHAEVFTSLLRRRLNEQTAPGRSVEVLNAGVDGYGTAQELLVLRHHLARFAPDLVLLSMYLGNDITDNYTETGRSSHYLERRCGRPYVALREGSLIPLGEPTDWRPSSPNLLDRVLRLSLLFGNLAPIPAEESKLRSVDVFRTEPHEGLVEAWALTQALVLAVRDEAAAQGARFAVLATPSRVEAGQQAHPYFTDAHDVDAPIRRLRDFLESKGLPYLDLQRPMRARVDAGERLYFERDSHFDSRGHAALADAIGAWLEQRCQEFGLPVAGCGR